MSILSQVSVPLARSGSPRARSILKGGISNVGSRLISALVGFFSVPLGLHYLGPERYGVWATVITTTSWVALLELGISSTLTNSISIAFAAGDEELAAEHTTNALAITCSIAASLGLIASVGWHTLNWSRIFNVSSSVPPAEVQHTMAIALVLVLLTPLSTIVSKILAGYQQAHLYSILSTVGSLGSLLSLYLGIRLHLAMPQLFALVAGSSVTAGLLGLLGVLFVAKRWLRPRHAHLRMDTARGLLSSGMFFFCIQIAGILVFNTDNIVVGHYLGIREVTPYSVSMRFVGYAQLLPASIFPSLWPAYAEANARGDLDWIRRAYARTMGGTVKILVLFLLFVVIFGRVFIRMWAGDSAVPSETLLLLMAVWTFISATTTVQSCLLGAVGRVRRQGLLSCVAAVMNLALSIVLVQRIGPAGAVLGTILSYLLVLVVPQTREVQSYFQQMVSRVSAPVQA